MNRKRKKLIYKEFCDAIYYFGLKAIDDGHKAKDPLALAGSMMRYLRQEMANDTERKQVAGGKK